jgi:hypothetical protein
MQYKKNNFYNLLDEICKTEDIHWFTEINNLIDVQPMSQPTYPKYYSIVPVVAPIGNI